MKAKAAGEDPYLSMLDHCNTPTQGLNTSPAQRLLSRRTRTLLPTRDSLLQPEVTHVTQERTDRQMRQANTSTGQPRTWTHWNRETVFEYSLLNHTRSGGRLQWWILWTTGPTQLSWTPEVFFGGIDVTLDGTSAQYPVCQTKQRLLKLTHQQKLLRPWTKLWVTHSRQ